MAARGRAKPGVVRDMHSHQHPEQPLRVNALRLAAFARRTALLTAGTA
jgi:hypothetical protein